MSAPDELPVTATNAASVAEMLADTGRLCPVFAGDAMVRGNLLRVRLGRNEARIRAPQAFLRGLFDWCDGECSLDDLAAKAHARWGESDFIAFVKDLLAAGVLVDAAQSLATIAARTLADDRFGRPAEREKWTALGNSLPEKFRDSTLKLPEARVGAFSRLLRKRRSAPAFADAPIAPEALAALLQAACGSSDSQDANGRQKRNAPSGGALYPCRIDVLLLRPLGEISRGAYRAEYDAHGGVGLRRFDGDLALLPRAFRQPDRLRWAAGVLVVGADLARSALKYRNRAYPLALIEAGAMLQNAALAAAEIGVGFRVMGGIDADWLARICRRDPESILVAAIFGSLPEEKAAPATPRASADFAWLDHLPEVPFHLARAALTGAGTGSSPCWGRDRDPALAHDKAIAEATERNAYRSAQQTVRARFDELPGAVDPRSIIAYRRGQYRAAGFPFAPFDPEWRYAWLAAVEATTGAPAWIMADCVCHPCALEPDDARPYTRATSSGCAAHPDPEQAARRAYFELIERDAFMRHWLTQTAGVELLAETLPAGIQARVRTLARNGCRVVLQRLDQALTPVFMVVVQHHGKPFTAVGAAAGDNAEAVLESALAEAETAAWARLVSAAGRRVSAGQVVVPIDHADLFAQRAAYRRADALLACRRSEPFGAATTLFPASEMTLRQLAEATGRAAYRIDLTRPDTPLTLAGKPLHTVRVVAPGLIPITFGYRRLPLGMVDVYDRRALFPHPFP